MEVDSVSIARIMQTPISPDFRSTLDAQWDKPNPVLVISRVFISSTVSIV